MMRSIERLPETTHSSVRSGVVICDLTRIVEELVFNSLDAGATEVTVSVGAGSFYIKVVDNGSGITREGLVLLGERYATSKVEALIGACTENLDFHGEALCSISDVSLLEVVTKARGKPNGYRKILKKRKCLFLEINNDRQEVGTTVTAHDIFYNQPVRRKHMQSSPKKVLDSIKMTVLRIALVHVNVLFRVVDVDSFSELICVGPASSPLPTLSTHFGIESSTSFHKLVLSDRELKLSGYISEPHGIFSLKAIQYVCIHHVHYSASRAVIWWNQLSKDINFRFVCKGPIHKLVNQLAAKFDLSSSWQLATSSEREKRTKYDKCPAFILHLQCPTSYYNIVASERSRTSVEFKDWTPVLTFIEDGVMRLWTKNMPDGNPEREKRWHGKQNSLAPLDLRSSHWEKPYQNHNETLALEETVFGFGKSCREASDLNKLKLEADLDLLPETDYISEACDGSMVGQEGIRGKRSMNHVSPWRVSSPLHVANTYGRKMDDLSSALGNTLPEYNENMDSISILVGGSIDSLYSDNDRQIDQEHDIPFLRSCSFGKGLIEKRRSPSRDETCEFDRHCFGAKRRRIDCVGIMEDGITNVISGGDFRCSSVEPFDYSPVSRHSRHGMSEYPVRDSVNSSFLENILPDTEQVWQSSRSGWSPVTLMDFTEIKFLDSDNYPIEKSIVEGHSGFGKDNLHQSPTPHEARYLKHSFVDTKYDWLQNDCSFTNFSPDSDEEFGESQSGFEELFSSKPLKRSSHAHRSPSPFYGEETLQNYSRASSRDTSPDEYERGRHNSRSHGIVLNRKLSFSRSHSAPPYYRGKRRFFDLTDTSSLPATRNSKNIFVEHSSAAASDSSVRQLPVENMNLRCSEKPVGQCHPSPMGKRVMDCMVAKRSVLGVKPETTAVPHKGTEKEEFTNIEPVECGDLQDIQDPLDSGWKWRKCSLATAGDSRPDTKKSQDRILDIFSDVLQPNGNSLVPKSVERVCLENAKVLSQVDKKFIAIVAGNTLAVIDQHAADERIKLEELRHKVLCGELKTIQYLDSEHELVLPEVGYQLLHNYAEQIQNWGWICNIHSQDSNSFTKHLDFLHKQPTVVKLRAVPCILGVILNDIDLLEFLQQLSDTDGSSTTPPSVLRILNSKACRGAIMFGDPLLPSECSLIVEELKQTSLCFQCAHGRPTTVPLLNLDLLHRKVARLGVDESWHGLRQHKLSLRRTSQRLRSAVS